MKNSDYSVGVHVKQPDGSWAVEVLADSLVETELIMVLARDGRRWLAPVKRILGRRGKAFVVHLDKKLRNCSPVRRSKKLRG